MTIELTPEQEKLVRNLVEAGQYESVEAFIEEAISEATTRTEVFIRWARERHQQAEENLAAGQVVTVPAGKLGEVLNRFRDGTLTFDS